MERTKEQLMKELETFRDQLVEERTKHQQLVQECVNFVESLTMDTRNLFMYSIGYLGLIAELLQAEEPDIEEMRKITETCTGC